MGKPSLVADAHDAWAPPFYAVAGERRGPPTRPARRHVPVGPAPSRIVVGAGGVWVLGQDAGGATVRRLEPASGAVRRIFRVGGTATGLAAGAGAVWVTRGAELLRLDPASGAVTASSRLCGRGTPVAGRQGVWVAGACVPEEVGTIGPATAAPGVAYRIDPASATPAGAPLRMPGLSVSAGSLAGGVLWLVAAGDDFRDGLTAGRFAVASGATPSDPGRRGPVRRGGAGGRRAAVDRPGPGGSRRRCRAAASSPGAATAGRSRPPRGGCGRCRATRRGTAPGPGA